MSHYWVRLLPSSMLRLCLLKVYHRQRNNGAHRPSNQPTNSNNGTADQPYIARFLIRCFTVKAVRLTDVVRPPRRPRTFAEQVVVVGTYLSRYLNKSKRNTQQYLVESCVIHSTRIRLLCCFVVTLPDDLDRKHVTEGPWPSPTTIARPSMSPSSPPPLMRCSLFCFVIVIVGLFV